MPPPVEMIEIPGRVDQVDQVSTILFRVWRFDEIAIHETSKDPLTYRRPARGSKRSGLCMCVTLMVRRRRSPPQGRADTRQVMPAVP